MKKALLSVIALFPLYMLLAQTSGCPDINAGLDQTLPCNQTCTNLTADVFEVGETTSYGVSSIPHSPPIAYNAGGGNAVSVNTDDVWSGVINLPFPFCFYGATYNSCIIGSNGAISFNTASANGYHPWPFSASVPSTALVDAGNIFTPYHDIDPSEGGSINWYLIGTAPCRVFVVSFDNIPHYNCTGVRSTHMAVLYETTNIIEVYVNNKSTCGGWNSGNTVIGIQNPAGTAGLTPPGRNTGNWAVNSPEAWQFKPSGAPIHSAVEWFDGPTLVGTGATLNVCPSAPQTTYTAQTTYTRCDGFQIIEEDDVTINYEEITVSVDPAFTFTCAGSNTTITATSPSATDYLWSPGGMTTATINVSPAVTTTYRVVASNNANGCTDTAYATVSLAQPVSSACNVLYVSPTGSSLGAGSKVAPYDLETALELGACNGTIIKMAVGDYITDTTINKVTSYLTLEGGFDPSINWDKVSTAGATRILRNATQTYSTIAGSIVTGSGISNEAGINPEVIAIEVNNQSGFRFQDITIETVLNIAPTETHAGYDGVDVYGVKLNTCADYNIVRTQIQADNGSDGGNQIWSIPATNGGNSVGLQANVNGAATNLIQSRILAGNAGAGGTGGGAAGSSNNVAWTGANFVTNVNNFNLPGQPTIRMDDISCTASNMDFMRTGSANWTFGSGSSPASATGPTVTTQYSTLGRKSIVSAADSYTGFANIILDSNVNPTFTTTAPFIQGQYRVCAGTFVEFTATNGGIGYVYHWSVDGSNVFSGTSFNSINGTFDLPGIFTIELSYETNCCGISSSTTLDLYVEDQPVIAMPPNADICLGVFGGTSLTVGGLTTNGNVFWTPTTGLNQTDSTTVVALPPTTTTYTVTLEDSTRLCSSSDIVTVNVIDLQLNMSATPSDCVIPGTASVNVLNGSGDYTYSWSNGGGNVNNINGLQPGPYTVYVTDNISNCMDSAMVNVPIGPGGLSAIVTTTNILCFGENNGTATVSLSGGTPPYTYTWSPSGGTTTVPDTFNTISNLVEGTYMVDIVDNTGCSFTATADVIESSQIIFVVDSSSGPSCSGVEDGFIRIRTDGGERPYNFSWSNGMPIVLVNGDVEASNLNDGTYVLIVVDDFACTDSITVTLNEGIIYTATVDTTICFGDNYTFPNGSTTALIADSSRVDSLSTALGCDSIVTTNVTVPALIEGIFDTTICNGITFTYNGTTYGDLNLSGTENLTAANGCDSVITVTITELAPITGNFDTTICNGSTFTYNGTTYGGANLSGTETLTSTFGCDSVITVTITELAPITNTFDTTLCNGTTFIYNGTTYGGANLSGTETFTSSFGCDSVITVTITELAPITGNFDTTICNGSTFTYNGTTYGGANLSGTETLTSTFGCDSVITVTITELTPITGNFDTTICNGATFIYNGTTYGGANLSGTETLTSTFGCDSVITVTITELAPITGNFDTTICNGSTFTYNGTTYGGANLSGTETLTSTFGCDSVITVTITELAPITGNFDTTICNGSTFIYNGTTYGGANLSGTENLTSTFGCDSVITVTITELAPITGNFDTTICNGTTFIYNGTTYGGANLSGIENLTAANGCDSVITLTITELAPITNTFDTTLCNGTTFVYNGTIYGNGNLSGTETFTSSFGCDSVITVTITELAPITNTFDTTLCNGTTFIYNGTTYGGANLSGTETFTSSFGCDSVITVTITELAPITNTFDTTLCNGTTFIYNGTTYGGANLSGTETFTSSFGCDSVITVTITELAQIVDTWDTSVCTGTTFVFNGTTYGGANLSGTETLTSAFGCDSIVTVTVSEFSLPTVGFTSTPNDTLCSGELLTLSGTGALNYDWDNGVDNGVAFPTLIGNTNYTVTGTDNNGCIANASVAIFGNPSYSFNINTTICSDEQHVLPDGSAVNTSGTYTTVLQAVNGCDSTFVTTLNVNHEGSFTPLQDVIVCDGFSQELLISSQNMVSFEWYVDAGSGNQTLSGNPDYLGATTNALSFNLDINLHNNVYTIQMIDECGRPYSSSMTIEVYEPHAIVNPLEDTIFCLHEIDVITVNYNGYDYEWGNGEVGASIFPEFAGEYIVNFVENYTNCLLSDTINIGFEDCIGNCVVLAPTGFSPNGSGKNDLFRVVTTCDEGFSYFLFNVYNRWGELIYSTDDWREGWDGTYKGRNAEIGTYSYYVEYIKVLTDKTEMLKGNVTIIR